MDVELKILQVNIDDLIEAEYNPRELTVDQHKSLKDSISRFGFIDPVIVNKNQERLNILIGGHQRVKIAKELGYKNIPAVFLDLNRDKERELNIRLNKNTGQWDMDMLANNFDMEELVDWGFLEEELTGIDDSLVSEGLTDEDSVPDVPEQPVSKLGDVWILGNHRLMCGDSTDRNQVERLMDSKKADMVFTDPPYGISFKSDSGDSIQNDDLDVDGMLSFNQKWQKTAYDVSNDNVFMMAWQSPRLFHLMDMFGDWKFFRMYSMYKSNRISYPHGAWINKTEPCLIFAKGNPKPSKEKYIDDCYVYTHDKESHKDSNVGHPTPKPVIMITDNLRAGCKKGSFVLDLFLGSGSTLIACEQTDRTCYGMELDPKYCDVIVKRWEDFTGKKAELVNNVI